MVIARNQNIKHSTIKPKKSLIKVIGCLMTPHSEGWTEKMFVFKFFRSCLSRCEIMHTFIRKHLYKRFVEGRLWIMNIWTIKSVDRLYTYRKRIDLIQTFVYTHGRSLLKSSVFNCSRAWRRKELKSLYWHFWNFLAIS